MTEKTLIILLSLIFLGTFITRNFLVKAKTKQIIRASDPFLTASIFSTTSCIAAAVFSTSSENFYYFLGPIVFLHSPAVSSLGLFVFALSIILGWIFSGQLGESWRVGVHENQKTRLIRNGIYQYIRNPYFLSHFVMFLGLFLVRPSIVMLALVSSTIALLHRLVLKEETYLLSIHGKEYEEYRKSTGRYAPRLLRSKQR